MRKILIHFFLLILFQNLSFSQTNYYVSPSGSDSNNGSINSPWETIQYGLNQLYYGDTLHITLCFIIPEINIIKIKWKKSVPTLLLILKKRLIFSTHLNILLPLKVRVIFCLSVVS